MIWGGTPRSSHWSTFRINFLRGRSCSGCDSTRELEAHHIVPFHIDPDRELDVDNLIPLCRECHYQIGHLRDWQTANPHVRDDAAVYLQRTLEFTRRNTYKALWDSNNDT
jgi:hypothetical protein